MQQLGMSPRAFHRIPKLEGNIIKNLRASVLNL